jgi:hypothetical protein
VKKRTRKREEKSEHRKLANRKAKVGLDESLHKDAIQRGYEVSIERIKHEWDETTIKILTDLKR